MKRTVQNVVVGAVIFHRGKILLLQRSAREKFLPGMWELPSGGRKKFENTEKALKREVKEETGLNISAVLLFSVFEYQIETPREIRDTVQITFLAKLHGRPKVILSWEHQDFAWVDAKGAVSYAVSTETRKVLARAFHLRPLIAEKGVRLPTVPPKIHRNHSRFTATKGVRIQR